MGGGVLVQHAPHIPQKVHKVLRLRCIGWILPVDVDTVEAQVCEEVHGAPGEGFATARGGCRRGEVGTVGPAADGEEGF